MSLADVAVLGSQTALGAVALAAGGAKVAGREGQIEAFRRFGYPQWFRTLTGLTEVGAGIGLLAGALWGPELASAGGLLFGGVTAGAVVTHVRNGDPASETAVPAVLFALTVALLAYRSLVPV